MNVEMLQKQCCKNPKRRKYPGREEWSTNDIDNEKLWDFTNKLKRVSSAEWWNQSEISNSDYDASVRRKNITIIMKTKIFSLLTHPQRTV